MTISDRGFRAVAVRAGAAYFALVFATGFALAPLRLLLLVPRVGTRAAELIEIPIMLAVTWLAARWTVRRWAVPSRAGARFSMGAIAFVLMLLAEFGLVLRLRGLTIAGYLATRDPVSGAAYYAALVLVMLMPLFVEKSR